MNCGRSAMGPRTVRKCLKKFPEAVPVSCLYQHFQRWTVRQGIPDSLRLRRTGRVARLDLYGMSLSLPPPNRPKSPKSSLSFSLKHVGETSRSRLFGVVSGRSESITGHYTTIFIMSSRYFIKSLTLVLGFHHWKELGLGCSDLILEHGFVKSIGGSCC